MCSRVLMFLLGAVCFYYQGIAADVYTTELMIEANVTLEAEDFLSALTPVTEFQVEHSSGATKVTLQTTTLVAECLTVGSKVNCSCSTGYIWSNEVCYNYNCCRESACLHNVSDITPLCVAKVKVFIKGSVTLNTGTWSTAATTALETNFGDLNGFEYLNVTAQRLTNTVADFEAAVSVRFLTSRLQDIVTKLESSLGAVLKVDTEGMVTIEAPEDLVCYESTPVLKCTFEEATDSVGWNMTGKYERFELNNGIVVKLDHCSTEEIPSCIKVTLKEVTGIWSGSYECGFTKGSVRHTANTQLRVALLPDEIVMNIEPLTVDCSERPCTDSVPVKVITTIHNNTGSFDVLGSYMGKQISNLTPTYDEEYLVYDFTAHLSCKKTKEARYVEVNFTNTKEQVKSARVDIPVIYAGAKFCSAEYVNGMPWPKTPTGVTVVNKTCEEGRVGFKSRTCDGTTWQQVFSYCVNEKLNKIVNAADNFVKGLGASQETAINIFEGLKNRSTLSTPTSSDSSADVNASIGVLSHMASASKNFVMQVDVLPDFVNAASNMLNTTWNGVNESIVQQMASNYLQSIEYLVKNIKANSSDDISSHNLELKYCSTANCSLSVFDIGVNLNITTGTVKTVAVKNIMDKLRNNLDKTVFASLLISATLVDNDDESLEVRLEFPQLWQNRTKPMCVFWNTTDREWSGEGCVVKSSDDNRTVCKCDHLTSFAVLMSKGDIPDGSLDIITTVGLGVSICSLLIFLIIECLVWSAVVKTHLSHFRHTAIVNIATFLLLADCSFLASTIKDLSDTWCLVLTVCKHLFYLAMFSWMLCMSVMLVHQLIFVFNPLRKRVFMFLSSIIGYVCPILIVGSSYLHCQYTNTEYYDKKTCWLVYKRVLVGSIHAFLLPVGTVILTNLFSMVVVIVTLMKSSAPESCKPEDKETAKSILKVVIFLTPVFGLTWIIGFVQLLLDEDTLMEKIAMYSFTILNSFQGLFLLITGCLAEKKVRVELIKLIMTKSKGKSESMKNLTASTIAKDK